MTGVVVDPQKCPWYWLPVLGWDVAGVHFLPMAVAPIGGMVQPPLGFPSLVVCRAAGAGSPFFKVSAFSLFVHQCFVLLHNALEAASLMWLKNGEIILLKDSGAYISPASWNSGTRSLTNRRTCSDALEERSLTCILPPHLHSLWQTPEATESTDMALMWVVHTLILFLFPTDLQEWKKNKLKSYIFSGPV